MKSKNIGINASKFCVSESGGAVQAATQLTKKLQDSLGSQTKLFGHDSISSDFPTATIDDTLCLSKSGLFGIFWEQSILPVRAVKDEIDILFSPNTNSPLVPTPFKNIVCIHDVNAQRGFSNDYYKWFRRLTVPKMAANADAVITVSQFSKSEIVEVFDIKSEKIHVVHNGIDEIFLSDSKGSEISLPADYILYVGAMNPRKNISGIVKAYKRLKKTYDLPHKLVLIGPKNKPSFKEISLDLASDIVVPGFLTKAQLKYAYSNADMFVFPSFYEGFGMPPIEAMACGTPVIASNTTSLPEVLGNAALLVDPSNSVEIADAMNRVLSDETLQDQMIEQGLQQSQNFTWGNAAANLIDIFDTVVD